MINKDEFNRVCKLAKLIEVVNYVTVPTWRTKEGREGIEYKGTYLPTFWFRDGQRIYEQPVEDKGILAVLGAFETDLHPSQGKFLGVEKYVPKNKTENKIPDVEDTGNRTNTENKMDTPKSKSSTNIIPELLEEQRIITSQDIEAWTKLSVFERILLFQKTPKELIRQRRGYLLPEYAGRDKKTLTDDMYKMFQYLEGNTMKKSANIAFLFQWSCVVESEKYFDNEVCVRGYIQVEIEGKMYRRPCGGSCIKKGMMDWGDTMEGAITEMTKRGIYHFLHQDVKSGEVV